MDRITGSAGSTGSIDQVHPAAATQQNYPVDLENPVILSF
jgi:hypothetical protein